MGLLANTPHEIASEVLMLRGGYPNRAIVLVEGPTDRAVLQEFCVADCEVIPVRGQDKVWRIFGILAQHSLAGLLAIVDLYFAYLERPEDHDNSNIIVADVNGIEVLLLLSPALEKVLRNTLDVGEEKIRQIAQRAREITIEAGAIFGCVRWLGYRYPAFNLSLRSVTFSEFIDFHTYEFDLNGILTFVYDEARNATPVSALLREIEELGMRVIAKSSLCNGHDGLSILATILPSICKDEGIAISPIVKQQLGQRELGRSLRMSYEADFFKRTQLYVEIKQWEVANKPYIVLKI